MRLYRSTRYILGFSAVVFVVFLVFCYDEEITITVPLQVTGRGEGTRPEHRLTDGLQKYAGSGRSHSYKQAGIHVAIGGGITGHGVKNLTASTIGQLDFFTTFLPSLCRTLDKKHSYHLYWGYDYNDPFYAHKENRTAFHVRTAQFVRKNCPRGVRLPVLFVRCEHQGSPAWAQNDAMFAAYLDGADYYYRVNDDTRLNSTDWAAIFISVLRGHVPQNAGVVGPQTNENTGLLTYDFTHRTHVDIMGYYYPRRFRWWYADIWIARFYKHAALFDKVKNVTLLHTMSKGKRYKFDREDIKLLPEESRCAIHVLKRYLERVGSRDVFAEQRAAVAASSSPGIVRVISHSLYGNKLSYISGAVRNAQLVPVIFPGWRIRFYIPAQSSPQAVPDDVVRKLAQLGAEIITVNNSRLAQPENWKYLVIFDEAVDVFLIRNADFRLSDREKEAVDLWLPSEEEPVIVIKDLPEHDETPIPAGLWGAHRKSLVSSIANPVSSTGDSFRDMIVKGTPAQIDMFIYRALQKDLLCLALDETVASENCRFVKVKTSPETVCGVVRVGQRYAAFDSLIGNKPIQKRFIY